MSRTRDKTILVAGVLSAKDVPAGWLSRTVSSGSQFRGFRGISVCKQIVSVDAAATAGSHAVSRAFSNPAVPSREATVTDEVYAFKNVAAAGRYLAAFQAPGAQTCLQTGLTQQTGAQVGVAAAPSHVAGVGDDNAGFDTVLSTTISRASRSPRSWTSCWSAPAGPWSISRSRTPAPARYPGAGDPRRGRHPARVGPPLTVSASVGWTGAEVSPGEPTRRRRSSAATLRRRCRPRGDPPG